MRWADALSTLPRLERAVDACAAALGPPPEGGYDLVVAFVSPAYDDLDALPGLLAARLPHRHLVGCTAGGVIAGGHEIEDGPALGIVAACLPGVTVAPFVVTQDAIAAVGSGPGAWSALVGGVAPADAAAFVVLADPFTVRADTLIEGLQYAYPGVPVVGGLASAGRAPGVNRLYLDGESRAAGAVGACLAGDLKVETVVAQGVRGIGGSHVITRADDQVLYELDGEPVFKVLERLFAGLPEEDAARASRGLFLGVAQSAQIDRPTHGDYLIRNVMGALEDGEALVVGEMLREGQVVRFHVRDGATSAEDLAVLLSAYAGRHPEGPPAGALLFSCLGRGVHLYGEPDHDTRAFKGIVGEAPLGGFFCNGEIGPVGEGIYLHGYTSAFALFRPAGAA